MELQIQNEKINIKQSISKTKKNITIEKDYILPDNKPDIIKVQTQNANIYVTKNEKMENKLKIDGGVSLRIAYLTSEGKNRVLTIEEMFSELMEVQGVTSETFINEKLNVTSIEINILNERKIHYKVSTECSIKASKKESIEFIHEINQNHQLQILNKKMMVDSYVGHAESKIYLKEKIDIENVQENIEVVKIEPVINNIENKMSYNKVLVKADCTLKCLYITESGTLYMAKKEVPLMGFLDIENVEDTNNCQIEITMRNLLVEENGKDVNPGINVEMEFNVIGDVYQNKEINLLEDLYCLNHKSEYSSQKIMLENCRGDNSETSKIKKKIVVEDINQLYDSEYRIINIEEKGNYIEGKIAASYIYSSFENPGINRKEEIIDFDLTLERQSVNSEVVIKNTKSIILPDSSIDVEIELEISSFSEKNEINLIKEIRIDDADNDDGYSMVVYIVKPGDSLWKIAKKFNSTIPEIVGINEITNEDKLNIGDKLYIPRAI